MYGSIETDGSAPAHIEIQSGFVFETNRYCCFFKRPIYLFSAILSILLWGLSITFIVLWVTGGFVDNHHIHTNKELWMSVSVGITAFLYVAEVLFCPTSRYLWNLNVVEDVVTYINRIKETRPCISISCECYHTETVTRDVTEYDTDANGNSQRRTRTETHTKVVVTHVETEEIYYGTHEDDSGQVTDGISAWNAIRVEFSKSWESGDQNTQCLINDQIRRFHERNKYRDVFYSSSVNMELDGYTSHMLSMVDLNKRPFLLRWSLYFFISLIGFSWPYKLWFGRITAKGRFHFRKLVYKTEP